MIGKLLYGNLMFKIIKLVLYKYSVILNAINLQSYQVNGVKMEKNLWLVLLENILEYDILKKKIFMILKKSKFQIVVL